MGLNWDRLDNAVSELWKFFAPALLNFLLVVILFLPVISSLSRLFLNFISGLLTGANTLNEIRQMLGRLNIENIPEFWDTVSKSISAATLLTIIVFLIFVFLLDVFTKWVGRQIPFTLDVDREKIVSRSPAAGIFNSDYSEEDIATTWRHARHSLDAREALSFYKQKIKSADDAIGQTVNNFTYDKAYIAFSILGIPSCIYFDAYSYVWLYLFLTIIFTYLAGRKIISIRDDYARSIYTDMEVFFYISDDDIREKFCMVNKPNFQSVPSGVKGVYNDTLGLQKTWALYKDYPVRIVLDESCLLSFLLQKLRIRIFN